MKKLVLLIVIIACVLVFGLKPGHAASELEIWCLAEGQTWDPVTSTCTVTRPIFLNSALIVLVGETISNDFGVIENQDSTIDNYGTINNYGLITNTNFRAINNYGTIYNYGTCNDFGGTITNPSFGTIKNTGTIINQVCGVIENLGGTIDNSGTIDNYGTINNMDFDGGTINNTGTIYNYCSGIYMGALPNGNPIVDYLCAYLPFIKR